MINAAADGHHAQMRWNRESQTIIKEYKRRVSEDDEKTGKSSRVEANERIPTAQRPITPIDRLSHSLFEHSGNFPPVTHSSKSSPRYIEYSVCIRAPLSSYYNACGAESSSFNHHHHPSPITHHLFASKLLNIFSATSNKISDFSSSD